MCFDMLACPYQDTCVKYGCPEIVAGFCRADDEPTGICIQSSNGDGQRRSDRAETAVILD